MSAYLWKGTTPDEVSILCFWEIYASAKRICTADAFRSSVCRVDFCWNALKLPLLLDRDPAGSIRRAIRRSRTTPQVPAGVEKTGSA
jgi:hypothetical protein